MSSRQWKLLRADLRSRFRLLSLDLIGYGESEPWTAPGPFDLSDDEAVVREGARLADEPAHLVGHSYGALLCLRAAARGELEVRSIAAYEPVAFGVLAGRDEPEARADLDRLGDELFTPEMDGTEAWMRRFVEYWSGEGAWDAMPAAAQRRFSAAAHKTFHEVDGIRRDATSAELYRAVRAPVLLMRGSETTIAERRTCEVLAETSGGEHTGPARVHLYELAPHRYRVVGLERPEHADRPAR
jgi:pimeloyl-ACP methyl ester carboxylesterase